MRSPDQLSEEEVRQFFLYLINSRKAAKSTVTIYLCGIKFFFEKTLGRLWPVFDLVRPRRSKKLPVVLSREEVRTVLKRIKHPVLRMALTTMYACGLRISEAVRLTIKDIDGDRHQLWVRCGKGGKDRAVPLPDHVLKLLRNHYKNFGNGGTCCFPRSSGTSAPRFCRTPSSRPCTKPVSRRALPRTPCVIHTPPTCWKTAKTSPPSRKSSGTPTSPPPRFTSI